MGNVMRPAPSWYRKLRPALSLTENTVILILLALGYGNESLALLIFKIASSYLKELLNLFLVSESEDIASKVVIEAGKDALVGDRPDDRNKP